MDILNNDTNLSQIANEFSDTYKQDKPFPNISFNNFFNPSFLDKVLEEFPDLSNQDSKEFKNKREIKLQGKGEKYFGFYTKQLMHYLNSEPFLKFLQELTGIEETLLPDPYFIGGGQHETKKGGFLKIHADFNKHTTTKLDRRLNLLVYLNKDWKSEYGGHFELWDKEMTQCVKKVLPSFNTIALFSTTDFSYHGLPDPLQCPENMSRKSLALYYYSNGRPTEEIISGQENHGTLFKARKNSEEDKKAVSLRHNFRAIIKDFIPPIFLKLKK